MSMSFAGNQKLSALSICARAIRMSVLALCGNSGVILLSVKRRNTLILQFRDVTLFRHLIKRVPGLASGIAYGDNGRVSVFLLLQLSYTQIMVGWVGAPKGAPVSVCAGYANPAQFTTSEIGVSGGGSYPLHTEAAIMATILP